MIQVTKHIDCVCPQNTHFIAQCRAFWRIWWHHARAFFLVFLEPVFHRAEQFCADRRPQMSVALVEPRIFTEYKPKQFAEDKDYKHFTRDGQFIEHEDSGVNILSFHQSIVGVNLWFDGKHRDISPGIRFRRRNDFVLCWFHHWIYGSEKQVQNDRKFFILNENLISSSSQVPKSTGNLLLSLKTQHKDISDREDLSFFTTSTVSWEQWNFHQVRLHGKMFRNLFLMEREISC